MKTHFLSNIKSDKLTDLSQNVLKHKVDTCPGGYRRGASVSIILFASCIDVSWKLYNQNFIISNNFTKNKNKKQK
jgi:hypothetical protein